MIGMSVTVQVPNTQEQLDAVRAIMRAFIAWHRLHHQQDLHLIDQYFDAAAFDEELATLPGTYQPPKGQLLLTTSDGAPAGCVALRGIDDTACEMKRMFVYPQFHGKGVGLALARELIGQARTLGYRCMRLDTSTRQDQAIGLYKRLGFKIIAPYYEVPEAMRGWLLFMELQLQ
jgi:ribosomal protein S18 acetylase RimI-like enzyme